MPCKGPEPYEYERSIRLDVERERPTYSYTLRNYERTAPHPRNNKQEFS